MLYESITKAALYQRAEYEDTTILEEGMRGMPLRSKKGTPPASPYINSQDGHATGEPLQSIPI